MTLKIYLFSSVLFVLGHVASCQLHNRTQYDLKEHAVVTEVYQNSKILPNIPEAKETRPMKTKNIIKDEITGGKSSNLAEKTNITEAMKTKITPIDKISKNSPNMNQKTNTTEVMESKFIPLDVMITKKPFVLECAADESLLSQQDLKTLINSVVEDTNIIQNINESYFDRTLSMRDELLQSLDKFKIYFANDPRHLKNKIQNLSQILDEYVPFVRDITFKLEKLPLLNSTFIKKLNYATEHLEELEKINEICSLNCDNTMMHYESINQGLRSKRSQNEKYLERYCSTIDAAKVRINNALQTFSANEIDHLNYTVSLKYSVYQKNILDLNLVIKKRGIKEFGSTMYDLMRLEGEIIDTFNKLKDIDVTFGLNEVKKVHLEIDWKMEELKQNLIKYRSTCLNCKNKHKINTRYASKENAPFTVKVGLENPLDRLIRAEMTDLQKIFESDIELLFGNLTYRLDHQEKEIDEAAAQLQPLHVEVQKSLKELEQKFIRFRSLTPKSSLNHLSTLVGKSKSLLGTLNDALHFLIDAIGK